MKSIGYIFRVTCASWIPQLRTYGYDIGWDMGFEFVFSVDIVLGETVGSPLVYSINMLLGLVIFNYFCTWGIYLLGVSLGIMAIFIFVTGGLSLVGL